MEKKEEPIIRFSDEALSMVICGRKTQTRIPVKIPITILEEMWKIGMPKSRSPWGNIGDSIKFATDEESVIGILEITNVRVECLQDISQEDAIAEGAPPSHPSINTVSQEYGFPDFSRSWFAQTWESIYGKESWKDNSWVWVISFEFLKIITQK